MIFDRVLAATGHDDDVAHTGLDGLLDAVLDHRLFDEPDHLCRLAFGRGKKSRSETCSGKDRLANRASHGADRIAGTRLRAVFAQRFGAAGPLPRGLPTTLWR